MQIVLLDKVTNLGGLGDVVKVKDGYACNFLILQGAHGVPRHRRWPNLKPAVPS